MCGNCKDGLTCDRCVARMIIKSADDERERLASFFEEMANPPDPNIQAKLLPVDIVTIIREFHKR